MNKTTEIPVEQRLSALLLKGWTMLSEACTTCPDQCPIMRSQGGQKYCCGCQVLINDKTKETQSMKFNDLISSKPKPIQPSTQPTQLKPVRQVVQLDESIHLVKQKPEPVKLVNKEETVSVQENNLKETTTRKEEKDVVLAALYGRLKYLAKVLNTLEDSSLIETTTHRMVTIMDAIEKYKSLSK